jgi:RNA polymerase sigma factor (sigma-70 family)
MKSRAREITARYYSEEYDNLVKKMSSRAGGKVNAEDVVQEAFTRAWQYSDSYDSAEPYDSWFNTILMNCLRDFLREERNQGRVRDSAPEEPVIEDLNDVAFKDFQMEVVSDRIENLNEPAKTIIERFLVAGDSAKVIAKELDITAKAVNQALFRFYKSMRDEFMAR